MEQQRERLHRLPQPHVVGEHATAIEKQTDREILWQVELTGKGGALTSFVQTYEVKVTRS